MSDALLLAKHGFVKSKYLSQYKGTTLAEREKFAKPDHADQEFSEIQRDSYLKSPFPTPLKKYRIIWEVQNMSVEGAYFWILDYVRQDLGYDHVFKTEDVFAASENSAFFGVSQLRLGGQQDKVSQFLATIGKMVKELFQLVRELRIIDERLDYYCGSYGLLPDGSPRPTGFKEADEITLKGIFIDMVQGGAKNPGSVFGMSREINFVSLPDLFFSTHPHTADSVDKVIDTQRGGFNKQVRNALKRHLNNYLTWKDKTYKEMRTRRTFTIKYLKQHYDIIRMYMAWVKPYLRHVKRLTFDEDKLLTPDMISAFEGSMLEMEFLAGKLPISPDSRKQNKHVYAVILVHFLYRTRPSMAYQQEGYQRGPLHMGRLAIDLRAYAWTQEEIDNYRALKDAQDFEMMKSISSSVQAAMEALGGSLEKYLKEASGEKEEQGSKPALTFLERFKIEFFGVKKPDVKKGSVPDGKAIEKERIPAAKLVKNNMFWTFKNFKKAHGMIMW